jgi:hypothetical protein
MDQKETPLNYKYKVLKVFSNRHDAAEYEIKLHNKFDVGVNPYFYNKCKQSSTGFDTTNINHTEETKRKMSLLKIEYYKKNEPHPNFKSNPRYGANNPMYDKSHSKETRRKISEKLKSINFGVGNKHTEETKRKMSISHKGERNGMFNGYYVYNDYKYCSLKDFSDDQCISRNALERIYKNLDRVITGRIYGKNPIIKRLGSKCDIIGKTYRECGINFIPKSTDHNKIFALR